VPPHTSERYRVSTKKHPNKWNRASTMKHLDFEVVLKIGDDVDVNTTLNCCTGPDAYSLRLS
jgi:hypothetical protein